MCEVSPDNVPILKAFGTALLIGALLSLACGKTYFRGLIVRDDDPGSYWVAVSCISGLCLFIWTGILLC